VPTLALLWAWTAAAQSSEPEIHRVGTSDGFEIVLSRYALPGAPAVVLCHGISSNHVFWDLEPGRSLAWHLHEAGYDVWNMDLRGHGLARSDGGGHRQHAGWTVDDYGERDLPAAFSYVLEASGASTLSYVGHSMGGMVLAVYLATHPDPPLSAAVVVGSPLDFRDPDRVSRLMFQSARFGTAAAFLPTPLGGRLLGWLGERAPLSLDEYLYNPVNMTVASRSLMMKRVVSPLSRGEVRQFGQMRRDGEFRSADGQIVYREQLHDVQVPMMFVAGRADRVVNPDRVWSYFEAVGSPHKEFVIASVANGFHGDYGHLDLGLGDFAAVDVFPRVVAWLEGHP
jgi:polyhydroxyalkanoate synthase